jgi:hypothetical protein
MIALLSFCAAIILNFNSSSISGLVIISIIQGLLFFGAILLPVKFVQALLAKKILLSILILCLILLIAFFYDAFFLAVGYLPAVTPAHFRTNIITGKCDFGGYSPNLALDPWYYQTGCNITMQEKIDILVTHKIYYPMLEDCKVLCAHGCSEGGCSDNNRRVKIGITCVDLMTSAGLYCGS